jgi:hypothetical protein
MGRRKHRGTVIPAGCDPWARLAGAILLQAALDAQKGGPAWDDDTRTSPIEARLFLLNAPLGLYLLDSLDVNREIVQHWVLAQWEIGS